MGAVLTPLTPSLVHHCIHQFLSWTILAFPLWDIVGAAYSNGVSTPISPQTDNTFCACFQVKINGCNTGLTDNS